jgi:hypothetical protein
MEKTLREKELIATQMIRKNDENFLLQRNLSLLKMALDKGIFQDNSNKYLISIQWLSLKKALQCTMNA